MQFCLDVSRWFPGTLHKAHFPVKGLRPSKPYVAEVPYTGCPVENMPDFGRMFLTLKYTNITQNTYVYPKLNGYGDNGQRSLKV